VATRPEGVAIVVYADTARESGQEAILLRTVLRAQKNEEGPKVRGCSRSMVDSGWWVAADSGWQWRRRC